jgi:ribosome-binding protein aMBF1 (putative translation factor)
MQGDRATYVLLPIEEYERLMHERDVDRLLARVEDPNVKWVDADDLAIELAAESVVKARKAAGLTQTQLAKKLGVPQSQISRIERNPDRTTVRTLKRIAKALRVDVSALI